MSLKVPKEYGKGGKTRRLYISKKLRHFADCYELDMKFISPHSFRHICIKNFLEKSADIAFLAYLMGQESIETTRIYLKRTTIEQQELINKIITW